MVDIMFYDDIIQILDKVFEHTLDNDIKFQIKKLKKKISLKKFKDLDDINQMKELFFLIEEVRFGFNTVKKKKIMAINIIEKIIKEKLGI